MAEARVVKFCAVVGYIKC